MTSGSPCPRPRSAGRADQALPMGLTARVALVNPVVLVSGLVFLALAAAGP